MENLESDNHAEFWQNVECAIAEIVGLLSNADGGQIGVREFWCNEALDEFTYEEIQSAPCQLFDRNILGLGNGATVFWFKR